MSVTTEKTAAREQRPPKPSSRALLAFYGVGIGLGSVVAVTTRILLGRSEMVVAGFIFGSVYVLVALPLLFKESISRTSRA